MFVCTFVRAYMPACVRACLRACVGTIQAHLHECNFFASFSLEEYACSLVVNNYDLFFVHFLLV